MGSDHHAVLRNRESIRLFILQTVILQNPDGSFLHTCLFQVNALVGSHLVNEKPDLVLELRNSPDAQPA